MLPTFPGRFMATNLLQKVGFLMVFICPFRTYFGPGWLERSTTGIYFLVMVSDCVSCLEAGIPGTSFYICWVRLMDMEGLEIQNEDEVNWDHLEQGGVQQTERQGYGKGLEKVSMYWVYLASFRSRSMKSVKTT